MCYMIMIIEEASLVSGYIDNAENVLSVVFFIQSETEQFDITKIKETILMKVLICK